MRIFFNYEKALRPVLYFDIRKLQSSLPGFLLAVYLTIEFGKNC